MMIETPAHAHELVAHWRGARPGKSPASWRRDAEGRRANAALARTRGRPAAEAVELEIAEIFEAAAVEREQEIAAATAAYETAKAAERAASDAMMRDLAKKHARR